MPEATVKKTEASREVSLDPALVPMICAVLLYAVSWIMGCSPASTTQKPASGKKAAGWRGEVPFAPEDANDKLVPTNSGRRWTIEKMAQRARTSRQFFNEEYGIAFEA